jgi:hypothetical protein
MSWQCRYESPVLFGLIRKSCLAAAEAGLGPGSMESLIEGGQLSGGIPINPSVFWALAVLILIPRSSIFSDASC